MANPSVPITNWEGINYGAQFSENSGTVNNNFYAPAERVESPPTPSFNVPFRRDDDFVDRGTVLEEIAEKCARPASRVALVGIGGVGKSQLAIEFCHRLHQRSPTTWVFWIYASNVTRLEQGFREIAESARIVDRKNPQADVFELVARWLQKMHGRWLLVLDSLDEDLDHSLQQRTTPVEGLTGLPQKKLSSYLPQSAHGTVLITSRRRDVAARFVEVRDMIAVEAMSEDDAASLLAKKLQVDMKVEDVNLRRLATVLECMPLALIQAAAFIKRREPRFTVSRYVEELQQSDRQSCRLLEHEAGHLRRDEEAKNSITVTWQKSFDYIREKHPSAADLLSLMSFFDSKSIPERVLKMDGHARNANDRFSNVDYDENGINAFEEDLDVLRSFSFVTVAVDAETFSMHRLVQLAMRAWLQQHNQIQRYSGLFVIKLLVAGVAAHIRRPEGIGWAELQALLPHVKMAETQEPQQHTDVQEARNWALMFNIMSLHAVAGGNLHEGELWCSKALGILEDVLGSEEEITMEIKCLLAGIYRALGRSGKAEELLKRTKDVSARVFGEEHPRTLSVEDDLIRFYHGQKRLDEAEQLLMQTIRVSNKVFGEEHPSTLRKMSQLALSYQRRNRLTEAEELGTRVMNASKRKVGEEHSDTLKYLSDLATTYSMQGHSRAAEKLYAEALKIREKRFGGKSKQTLASMVDLAKFYEKQGRLKQAEELLVKVMDIWIGIRGDATLKTSFSMFKIHSSQRDLIVFYREHDMLEKAEELAVESLEFCKAAFEESHLFTRVIMLELFRIYTKQGRLREAGELGAHTIGIWRTTYGEDDAITLKILEELGQLYRDQLLYDKAAEIVKQLIDIKRSLYGDEHPATLRSYAALAATYFFQSRYDEAEEIELRMVVANRKVLGQEHPDTLRCMRHLAILYHFQRRYDEAEELGEQVVKTRRKVLGGEHRDTILAMRGLADTLYEKHRQEEAIELMSECAGLNLKIHGPDDPLTKDSFQTLSRWTNEKDAMRLPGEENDIPALDADLD